MICLNQTQPPKGKLLSLYPKSNQVLETQYYFKELEHLRLEFHVENSPSQQLELKPLWLEMLVY